MRILIAVYWIMASLFWFFFQIESHSELILLYSHQLWHLQLWVPANAGSNMAYSFEWSNIPIEPSIEIKSIRATGFSILNDRYLGKRLMSNAVEYVSFLAYQQVKLSITLIIRDAILCINIFSVHCQK